MYNNACHAYQSVDYATMSGRETEARVLSKAALKLKECLADWNPRAPQSKLNEALRYNQQVWSILQAELSRPDNPLPQKLRMDLLRLAMFIDKRIIEVMARPAPDKLHIIIRINNGIAAGLTGRAE